ncbi:MAG: PilZ domain-containing protein [Halobacteriovoraceae bacterium]|jgi:hypothetical protein|nr:PilZ domain-containing protein [Halobacteriovoraceae bacterium]
MATANDNSANEDQTLTNHFKQVALVIGHEEFIKINMSNQLSDHFDYNVISKDSLEEGIDFLSHSNCADLIIIDFDDVEAQTLERFFSLINHVQTPCLIVCSNANQLAKLRNDLDDTFISLLPKGIINTMFKDTINLLLEKVNQTTKVSKRLMQVSTHEKPLTLYVLAATLIFEPIIKILYLKFQTGFEWEILARTIMSIEGFVANFEFWALFPLAGYALISIKVWSFFFFVGLQIYTLYTYFTYEKFTWPYVAETPHVSTTLLLFFNIALIIYFLVPENRRPFWSQTRRLWRNTSRYHTNLQTLIKSGRERIDTTITNISSTGAYFTSKQNLPIGHKMQIEITINGEVKHIEAIVRRTQETAHKDYFGYGIEFSYNNKEDKLELKKFIENLNQKIQ